MKVWGCCWLLWFLLLCWCCVWCRDWLWWCWWLWVGWWFWLLLWCRVWVSWICVFWLLLLLVVWLWWVILMILVFGWLGVFWKWMRWWCCVYGWWWWCWWVLLDLCWCWLVGLFFELIRKGVLRGVFLLFVFVGFRLSNILCIWLGGGCVYRYIFFFILVWYSFLVGCGWICYW